MRRLGPVVIVGLAVCLPMAACAERDDGLHRGKVEIDRSTTTTDRPCDVPAVAERAITEATFGASRLDAAGRATVEVRLDELRTSLPPDLHDEVEVLAAAFERVWSDAADEPGGSEESPEPGEDPFDTPEYLTADQAIRRYVDGGCAPPS